MRREVRGARHGVWAFWITCELRNPHRSRSMFQVPSAWMNRFDMTCREPTIALLDRACGSSDCSLCMRTRQSGSADHGTYLKHSRSGGIHWKNPQKNSRRDSERGRSGRHIAQHHAHSSDLCAACNANATQYLGVRAEVDVILNYWGGSIRLEGADGHTLAKGAVTANDCTRVNKDISEVVYAQSRSDLCFQR